MKAPYFLIPLALCLATLTSGAQSKLSDTTVVADEVVAVVGNATILLSDVERQAAFLTAERKARGTLSNQTEKEEAFELLLNQMVLSQQARADSLDKDMAPVDLYVEEEIKAMVRSAGSVQVLEEMHGKPIYQIRSDLSRRIQDMELARMMQNEVRRKTTIGYDEVVNFARNLSKDSLPDIPLQYCFSKIVKVPPQTEERKYAIREKLLEYRRQVMSGEKQFSVLARFYSMDGSAINGGEMGPMGIKDFVGSFAEAIESMDTKGQVSEIVETEYGLHIIEFISYDRLTGMAHVRHLLLKPEFTIEEAARVSQELDSLAAEVRSGRTNFAEAASRLSDDTESRHNGGKAFYVRGYLQTGDMKQATTRFRADQLAEMAPADYRQIRSLQPGGVSNSYETVDSKGTFVLQIIRLDEVIEAHPASLEQDYSVLHNMALGQKQMREFDAWLNQTIERMFIEIEPAYGSYKLEREAFAKKIKKE